MPIVITGDVNIYLDVVAVVARPEEITKIIQKFPTNKAPWKDNINAKLLKVINKYDYSIDIYN